MDFRTVLILSLTIAATGVYGAVQECHFCTNADTNVECRNNAVDTCGDDQSCQTIVSVDGSSNLVYTKGCVDSATCSDDESNNHDYCKSGMVKDTCSYCCDEELCNDDLPRYFEAFDDCSPWSGWSSCSGGERKRTRECCLSSGSGSGSSRKSGSKSGGCKVNSHSHSHSKEASGEATEEIDDCTDNTCYACSSVVVNPSASLDALVSVFVGCSAESCADDEMRCSTEITYNIGVPTITKGCQTVSTCDGFDLDERCPTWTESDSESLVVAVNLISEADLECNYCCDNGADDVVCNSGILPNPKYMFSAAFSPVGSFLTTLTMAVLVRLFA